ncbi:CRISPR-associated protein Cas4 [Methylocaldum szegediense]|uniref:CRISPR-associated protein Cas4 n=1 Tax=Methylocaldum szegediense TaxID=73780 RepID=UPI0003F700F6|nr:CRISPR-associated protein Cas4 [Methylocaldum szegediense]
MPEPDQLIAISALQHYSYCPRQCALIHQEQTFTENVFTVRGRFVHERVDEPETRTEGDREIQTSVPLVSERLGLIGKSDVVEILPDGSLRPVEYKHGRRRRREHDDIQVAAQAICLEEMTGKQVAEGVIYHHSSRRRRIVPITPELRAKVEDITKSVRDLLRSGVMPPPTDDPALCRGCSLKEACQPELVNSALRIRELAETLFEPDDMELAE